MYEQIQILISVITKYRLWNLLSVTITLTDLRLSTTSPENISSCKKQLFNYSEQHVIVFMIIKKEKKKKEKVTTDKWCLL